MPCNGNINKKHKQYSLLYIPASWVTFGGNELGYHSGLQHGSLQQTDSL